MLTAFRWLLRIFSGLVVLAIAATGLAYYFAVRSLPDYDEDFALGGISQPVEIVRDTADVPHVFAMTDLLVRPLSTSLPILDPNLPRALAALIWERIPLRSS